MVLLGGVRSWVDVAAVRDRVLGRDSSTNNLKWCALNGVPFVFVSGGAPQLRDEILQLMDEKLDVPHHFAVANTPWTHGTTVERVNREEMIRTFRSVLDERCRLLRELPTVVLVVQWGLTAALRTTLFQLMMERSPRTALLSVLRGDGKDRWIVQEEGVCPKRMLGRSWLLDGWSNGRHNCSKKSCGE